jgi:hypothetical protein
MQRSAAKNHLLQNQTSSKCKYLETVIFTSSNQDLIAEYVDLLKNPEYQSNITESLNIIVNSINLSKIN